MMNTNTPFSDEEIRLASSNYEAQEWLFREIWNAFKMSGRTISEIAAALELDEAVAYSWISGEVDLQMSEIRQLANAIDAKISYRVQAIDTLWRDRAHGPEFNSLWDEGLAWTSSRSSAAPRVFAR